MEAKCSTVLLALLAACGSATATTPPPVSIELDRPSLITVGQTYRVAETDIGITPHSFTPLDTQAGHVLTASVTATEAAASETLSLHAYVAAFQVPVIWHGLSFQLP